MHEFHAWIGLAESTVEDDDVNLSLAVEELKDMVDESKWHDAIFEVRNLNGRNFGSASLR
jgi:hypothetical protein